jgi:4-hydroxybenzoate polyprenyltransferase
LRAVWRLFYAQCFDGRKGGQSVEKLKAGITGEEALALDYLRLLRPKQWIKNLFVFAALIFARDLFQMPLLGLTALAFVLFCLASSGVYIINDILDVEHDRNHPIKRHRPIAAGRVPVNSAAGLSLALLAAGLAGSFLVARPLGFVTFAYILLMVFYSLYLKQQVILDIFTIAAGFVLRVVAGAAVTGVYFSPWLLLCTIFLSLFIALGKRRHELYLLDDNAAEHRSALSAYSFAFIDQMVGIATSATIISYSLYTFLAPTNRNLIYTIPFVLYGLFRYLFVIYQQQSGGAPEEVLLRDRPLLAAVLLWIIACAVILYLGAVPWQPVLALSPLPLQLL